MELTEVYQGAAAGSGWHRGKKKIPSHKKMSRVEPSEEKQRSFTVRLFGMNSLKEGAVWRNAWKPE
jgi:hypothetical protein